MRNRLIILLLACAAISHAIERDAEGTYLIATPQDLLDFAALVNGGETYAAALLTSDVDMTGLTYTPIGKSTAPYQGTFDGQGHTIDNVVLPTSTTTNGMGLFGYVGAATLRGIIAGEGNRIYGGAFVGGLAGDKVGSGICLIDCCGHEGQVKGSQQNAAAIVGCVHDGNLIIQNSYNTGKVAGARESAIFCGSMSGSKSAITNCYNTGTLTAGVDGGYYLWRSSPTVNNVFDAYGRQ
ncbi:MAG: hypothetical protein HUK03_03430, partial [Bacteroidaceae bacterium]|nr:hypothetical protein [Bacteroidaceae bacterium]